MEYDYITNFIGKPNQFYSISKIYKNKKMSNACGIATDIMIKIPNPNDLKLRHNSKFCI